MSNPIPPDMKIHALWARHDIVTDEMADYFYLIGTTLFFIKACLGFVLEIKNRNRISAYDTIN